MRRSKRRPSDKGRSGVYRDFFAPRVEMITIRVDAAESGDDPNSLEPGGVPAPAVYFLDAHGYIVGWSRTAAELFGYQPSDILGRHPSVMMPPEVAASGFVEMQLQRAQERGVVAHEGWRLRCDQSQLWVSVVITPLSAVKHESARFAVIVRDETCPKQRLQRSDQRFADLFAVSPVGIAVLDEDGWLADANAALGQLLGCELEHLYGRSLTVLLADEDSGVAILPAACDSASHITRQRVLARRDQGVVHCDLHVTRSHDAEWRPFWLVAFHDITERHERAERLRHQATHDELTGLANRRAVLELLDRLLRPDANTGQVGVLFCDIDHFKRINDALGHEAGDEVLLALAERLRSELPDGCIPARQAGDEFLIVCPDVDTVDGLQPLIETVSELLRARLHIRGQILHVSASVGAVVLGESPASAADLVRFADAAMFEAKTRGPGRAWTADETLKDTTDRSLTLENDLRQALPGGQLVVHYQPIVAADGHIFAAEALVRWPHPRRGLLEPNVFLPVARRAGLLGELDLWVLGTALQQAADWPAREGRSVDIAINLGEFTPDDPHFVDTLTELLETSGINPARVVLEITETALLDQSDQYHLAMSELVRRGVRFAIDDFGTGYSCLGRLTDLPVEIIKIDRQFVAGLPTNQRSRAVIDAVTNLAHALNRTCVAEGVETTTELNTLTSYAISGYQGWLFHPALPHDEFRHLIE